MKKVLFSIITAIALVCLSSISFAQSNVTILSQNFSTANGGTPPSGWTTSLLQGSGGEWRFDNPAARGFFTLGTPNWGSPFAIFDRPAGTSVTTPREAALTTPLLDLSIYSSATLSFEDNGTSNGGENVEISTDGGSTYSLLILGVFDATNATKSNTVDISQYAGMSNIKIRFRMLTNSGTSYWAIDNVLITGVTAAQCTSDSVISAPITVTGNTDFANNDCNLSASNDYQYEVNIPCKSNWTFQLCNSSYDTKIFLATSCCGMDIASSDDDCNNNGTITAILNPGTYYVTVEGKAAADSGAYVLGISNTGCQYCDASNSDCGFNFIAGVQLTNLSNTTPCTSYSDFTTSQDTAKLFLGVGETITMIWGSNTVPNYVTTAYIDWNQDFDFDDPNEMTQLSYNAVDRSTATITPPAGALNGFTRMRLRMAQNNTAPSCGPDVRGEVEDYTIFVEVPQVIATPDTTVLCLGESTTIRAVGYNGSAQSWESSTDNVIYTATGQTADTILVSPTDTTYYRYVDIGVSGNDTSNVIQINVLPLANGGSSTIDNDTVCQNNSTVARITGYDGNIQWQFSSDNISFTDVPSATADTLEINSIGATSYFRALLSNQCGADTSNTLTVVVIPSPSVSNVTETCDGSGTNYVVSFTISGGDGNYTVTGGSGMVSGNTFTSDPITSNTSYTFNVFDGIKCDSIIITGTKDCQCANTAGTGQNADVCNSDSPIDLLTLLTGADQGGTFTDVDNSGAFNGSIFDPSQAAEGSYNFIYVVTGPTGCDADSAFITINVNGSPLADNVIVTCSTDSSKYVVTFDIVGGDQNTYQVTGTPGTLTGTSFVSDTLATGNAYNFSVSDAGGCAADVVMGDGNECLVSGIENYNISAQIIMYPNPTNSLLNLNAFSNVTIETIEIYSVVGQLVYTNTFNSTPINVSQLNTGTYIVKLHTNKGTAIKKLVIK